MSRSVTIVGAVLLCLACPVFSHAATTGNANFLLGFRNFDAAEWDPIDDQPFVGFTVDIGHPSWVADILAGLYITSADETVVQTALSVPEVEFTTIELSFGLQKTWEDYFIHARPYVGGGFSVIRTEVDVDLLGITGSDEDTSLGLFLSGGYKWRIGESFNLGFEARLLLGTDIELGKNDKVVSMARITADDVDYAQLGVNLGWGW